MTPEQFAAIRDRATRPRRTVPIVCDGELAEPIEALHAQLEALLEQLPDPPDTGDRRLSSKRPAPVERDAVAALQGRIDAAYADADVESATLNVVVQGLPGTPWQAMKTAYPPRPDVPGDRLWGFNVTDGRDALIRQTVIGHRDSAGQVHPLDPDELDWLLGFCTDFQLDQLFLAGLETSRGTDAVPLPRLPSTTRTSAAA